MTEYMKKRKLRIDEKKVEDSSLFGLMSGIILILISFLRWIVTYLSLIHI